MIVGLSLVALTTAVISAMAGMGGGMILIGVLFAVGMAPAMALPLHAGVQLASNGSRCVAYRADIKWSALGLFLLGAVPAALAAWMILSSLISFSPASSPPLTSKDTMPPAPRGNSPAAQS